jgi:hypothetical protein
MRKGGALLDFVAIQVAVWTCNSRIVVVVVVALILECVSGRGYNALEHVP